MYYLYLRYVKRYEIVLAGAKKLSDSSADFPGTRVGAAWRFGSGKNGCDGSFRLVQSGVVFSVCEKCGVRKNVGVRKLSYAGGPGRIPSR